MPSESNPVIVALTGASGSIYGLTLIAALLRANEQVDILLSEAGRAVVQHEAGLTIPTSAPEAAQFWQHHFQVGPERLRFYAAQDWNAPMASGSGGKRRMVICPCTMGTLAAIANGLSDTLLERAADVAIKEGWPLLLVARETPLSVIHLQNMTRLAQLGVVIMPAAPGFYHHPQQISDLVAFMVSRILDRLAIPQQLVAPWPIPLDG